MEDNPQPDVIIEDIGDAERAARRFAPLLMLRGAIGIIAGIVLLFWPGAGLAVTAVALGIFLIIDGIERLVTVLRRPPASAGVDLLALAGAVLRIIFGAVILFNPVDAGGFWASFIFVIAGINLIVGSLFMFWKDSTLRDDPMNAGTAVLMMILGLLMILMPMVSAMVLLRILGGILILAAIPSFSVGLRSRR